MALFLSPDEASALARVLENIGGHRHTTPRGLLDAIYAALLDAGVRPNRAARIEMGRDCIVFADALSEQAAAAYEKARAETPLCRGDGEVPRPKINRFI